MKNVILSILGGIVGSLIVLCTLVGLSSDTTKVPSVATIQKSVVFLEVTHEGQTLMTCSGYVRQKDHSIVTAAHCVPPQIDDPANNLMVMATFQDGQKVPVKTIHRGDQSLQTGPDLAILSVDTVISTFPTGLVECKAPVQLGDTLGLFGAPLGINHNVSFGHVSNIDVDITQYVGKANGHFIGYDGQAFPGNSGGPAVELSSGCVVGIAEFIMGGNEVSNYGINGLTPISALEKIGA